MSEISEIQLKWYGMKHTHVIRNLEWYSWMCMYVCMCINTLFEQMPRDIFRECVI